MAPSPPLLRLPTGSPIPFPLDQPNVDPDLDVSLSVFAVASSHTATSLQHVDPSLPTESPSQCTVTTFSIHEFDPATISSASYCPPSEAVQAPPTDPSESKPVPRPQNAFFLWKNKTYKPAELKKLQTPAGKKKMSTIWKSLPAEVQRYWHHQSELEKIQHLKNHPGYTYKPGKGKGKGTAKRRRTSRAATTESNPPGSSNEGTSRFTAPNAGTPPAPEARETLSTEILDARLPLSPNPTQGSLESVHSHTNLSPVSEHLEGESWEHDPSALPLPPSTSSSLHGSPGGLVAPTPVYFGQRTFLDGFADNEYTSGEPQDGGPQTRESPPMTHDTARDWASHYAPAPGNAVPHSATYAASHPWLTYSLEESSSSSSVGPIRRAPVHRTRSFTTPYYTSSSSGGDLSRYASTTDLTLATSSRILPFHPYAPTIHNSATDYGNALEPAPLALARPDGDLTSLVVAETQPFQPHDASYPHPNAEQAPGLDYLHSQNSDLYFVPADDPYAVASGALPADESAPLLGIIEVFDNPIRRTDGVSLNPVAHEHSHPQQAQTGPLPWTDYSRGASHYAELQPPSSTAYTNLPSSDVGADFLHDIGIEINLQLPPSNLDYSTSFGYDAPEGADATDPHFKYHH